MAEVQERNLYAGLAISSEAARRMEQNAEHITQKSLGRESLMVSLCLLELIHLLSKRQPE